VTTPAERFAIVLQCSGIGDCLYAVPVLRKIRRQLGRDAASLTLFTHHPGMFARCPYVDAVHHVDDVEQRRTYERVLTLFDPTKLPHHLMDTTNFISVTAGLGELSFREKQLEYFPTEEDRSQTFDVVLNTSMTWPSRSWPLANWQRLADALVDGGNSVAVVGKDVEAPGDLTSRKTSPALAGCTDLTNRLSLDQTYFTIARTRLFVSCQNGLSVLGGATDTEMVVLDQSIEWSKRALYRHEDPHYRFTLVRGSCEIYCAISHACPVYGEFRCIPDFESVWQAVSDKLARSRLSGRR
jgi:ADP-heptose:LPS heptosyltransferase